ncbi:UNVERIFIED_CONTAM: hypothetical protein K2H54_060136 [Gekko kuhli]
MLAVYEELDLSDASDVRLRSDLQLYGILQRACCQVQGEAEVQVAQASKKAELSFKACREHVAPGLLVVLSLDQSPGLADEFESGKPDAAP